MPRVSRDETDGLLPSSFRDPSGFLFRSGSVLYRQVNPAYQPDYDHFVSSGLCQALLDKELLIPHEEAALELSPRPPAYRILRPDLIGFVSYPYEWSFSQLKAAALTTIAIQKEALAHGMWLKDASAYNIQFRRNKPILIDTLSFERHPEGQPWVAYRQFCQHFLAPLALMAYSDISLNQLLRIYIDGIPLDLAARLLPASSLLRFSLLTHIHLHARAQQRFADSAIRADRYSMTHNALMGIIDNLEAATRKLRLPRMSSVWSNYYSESLNYTSDSFEQKKRLTSAFLEKLCPKQSWDLGSNVGIFSGLCAEKGIPTIAFDKDPLTVDAHYRSLVASGNATTLPLVLDLTNPSPSLGWSGAERMSLLERGPTDTVLALALIHHLAISNNVPLGKLALFFSEICNSMIIEFVPKSDSQVQKLLRTRPDVFPGYTRESFEAEFSRHFSIQSGRQISGSERFLYLMTKR
jgi:hypothetical protein